MVWSIIFSALALSNPDDLEKDIETLGNDDNSQLTTQNKDKEKNKPYEKEREREALEEERDELEEELEQIILSPFVHLLRATRRSVASHF